MATGLPSPLPMGHPTRKAAYGGDFEGLQRALEGVENPNSAKDGNGCTLYYWAAWGNQPHIMQWLFSIGGCNPNAQHNYGHTPGLIAMSNSSLHALLLWLHHGGDPNIANEDGKNALHEDYAHNDISKAVSKALRECTRLEEVLQVLRAGHIPAVSGVSRAVATAVNTFLASGNKEDVREADLVSVVVGLAKDSTALIVRALHERQEEEGTAQRAKLSDARTAITGKVDAVERKVDAVDNKVAALAAQGTSTEGKVDSTRTAITDALTTMSTAMEGKVDVARTVIVDKVDAVDTKVAALSAQSIRTEDKVDAARTTITGALAAMSITMEGKVDDTRKAISGKVDSLAGDMGAQLGALTTALQAVQDTVNHRDIVQTKLQAAKNTIADLRHQLNDTTAQLEDARKAAAAADTQHAAAIEDLKAKHTTNMQDTINAHAAIVAGLEEELAAARSEAAASATKHQAAVEDMQEQHGAQIHHLHQLLADARSQLAAMTAEAAALASAVKSTSSMMSTRKPWPSGITAEDVADIITAGLSSPNTSPPTTLLLYGLHTHSPDAVMAGINQQPDVACSAVVDMLQSDEEGEAVCREAMLLAWLVASAHKTNPGPHWPSMTRVIGSLYGVFRGPVEHDDPCGVVERARRGYMSCELGHVLGLQALHMLLDMHPEDKYRLVGYLTEDDMMVPREGAPFFDGGRDEALTQWSMLCGAEFQEKEVIVVDPSTDEALSEMMAAAVSVVGGIVDMKAKATALAVFVQEQLGGSIAGYTDIVEACKEEIAEQCMGSRELKLGELTIGVCRHRAILYKLLADLAGIDISCRLQRGDLLLDDGKTQAPHAWNVVSIEAVGDTAEDEGKTHEYFIVDVMRGAALIPSSSGEWMEYKRSGGGTSGGATLLGEPGDLTMEEVASLPHSAKLGSGSSGNVYSARDRQAVKIIDVPPSASMEAVMREVKVMSALRHRYLMPLKQHLAWDRTVALVMPRGDHPLSKLSPGTELAPLLLQVALGMEHLHGRRRYIVHRDLKPSNIILFKEPGGITVAKVGDFGSAKVSKNGTSLTAHTRVCTPGYAAPEQRWDRGWEEFSGVRVSPASDVYAFGQVVGQMYTGLAPSTLPPPQHQYTDAVLEECGMPQPLKSLYRWCTAADAEDRPTSEDVVDALVLEVQAGLARKALEA